MVVKNNVKYWLGCALIHLYPARAALLRNNFTLPYWHDNLRNSRVERLIRYTIGEQALDKKTGGDELEHLHKNFWRSQPSHGWFAATSDRHETEYLQQHSEVIELIQALCAKHRIQRVCEIGTGNGKFLHFLQNQLPDILRFIGIDLNPGQIALNQAAYPDIEFVADDALPWICRNATANTLYLTNGGVLEYFSEASVRQLFEVIRRRCPGSLLALLIEPLASQHDLQTVRHSLPHGNELSFSHNYPHLMEAAGIEIRYRDEYLYLDRYRSLDLIGYVPALQRPRPRNDIATADAEGQVAEQTTRSRTQPA